MSVSKQSIPLISLGSHSIQIRAEASVVLTPEPIQFPFPFYTLGRTSQETNKMAAILLYLGLHETSWSCVKPSLPAQAPQPFLQFSFCHSCIKRNGVGLSEIVAQQ